MEQVSAVVPVDAIELPADISLPDQVKGLVLFAHRSGSGRHSQRNQRVADVLNRDSIGTGLIDLLTEKEEAVNLRTSCALTSFYWAIA